jgi:hypothetical protein
MRFLISQGGFMEVQKIASYEQRMQEYREECLGFWLKEFTLVAAIGALVVFGGMYGLSRIGITPDLDWRVLALLLWGLMLIPPVKMLHPEKPNPNDVLRDQALRQAAGMDDSVNE